MWPRAEAGSTKFNTCPEKSPVRPEPTPSHPKTGVCASVPHTPGTATARTAPWVCALVPHTPGAVRQGAVWEHLELRTGTRGHECLGFVARGAMGRVIVGNSVRLRGAWRDFERP